MKKRISAMLLVLCMMVSLLPIQALATDGPPDSTETADTAGTAETADLSQPSAQSKQRKPTPLEENTGFYYIYSNEVPENIGGTILRPKKFGPWGDNTPLKQFSIDLNELFNKIEDTTQRQTAKNTWQSEGYVTAASCGYEDTPEQWWAAVIDCMDDAGKEYFTNDPFGKLFEGYVIRYKDNDRNYPFHCNGTLDATPPLYLVELKDSTNNEYVNTISAGTAAGNTVGDVQQKFKTYLEENYTNSKVTWSSATEGLLKTSDKAYKIALTYEQGLNTGSSLKYEKIGNAAGGKGYFRAKVTMKLTELVTITPADITIYTGGNGYTGAVDGNGGNLTTNSGLPTPAFYVTLPADVEAALKRAVDHIGDGPLDLTKYVTITATAGDGSSRSWTLEPYTDEGNSTITIDGKTRYIYRLKPAQGQEPVRMLFKDEQGNVVTTDDFIVDLNTLYQEFEMSIYTNTVGTSSVEATISIPETRNFPETRSVVATTGTLTVRGLVNENFANITTTAPPAGGSDIVAVAESGNAYYVNGNKDLVVDAADVKLLVDDIVDSAKAALTGKIASMGYNTANVSYKYFDLVDATNGNAWITSDKPMTIYVPYTGTISGNTQIHVIHFDGLDRNYNNLNDKLAATSPKVLNATYQNGYIVFKANSFSPFALVLETRDSGNPVDPDPEPEPTEHTLRFETNGGETIKSITEKKTWTMAYEDLPIPERDGYTFEGWYRNSTLTMPVTGDVRVYGTVTLFAKWSEGSEQPGDSGVSKWLNTGDHNAYMKGYLDGTFAPGKGMTRAEAAQMFYNLLLDKEVPVTTSFTDVPADAWYAKAVNSLASLGILEGIGNNLFAPDRPITRAEFTVIAMRFTNGDVSGENIFSDVSADDWFYDQVVGSIQYGWITGYEDGTFRPNTTIARAEVTTIVNRMLGRSADEDYVDRHEDDLRLFPDVSQDYWAYYQIAEATNAHDYTKEDNAESWIKLK